MSKQNDFAMDYSALAELAKQVSNMQTDFTYLLKSLDDLVASLDGQWQGKAQVEFAVAYSKLKPELDTISEVLQNYATEINNAVVNEQDMECINKALANKLHDQFKIKAVPINKITDPTF